MADTYAELADDPTQIADTFTSGDFGKASTNLANFIAQECSGIDTNG